MRKPGNLKIDESIMNSMMLTTQSFFEKISPNCADDMEIQFGSTATQELLCYRKFQLFDKYQKECRMTNIKLLQGSMFMKRSRKNTLLVNRMKQLEKKLEAIQEAKLERYSQHMGKEEFGKWKLNFTKRVRVEFRETKKRKLLENLQPEVIKGIFSKYRLPSPSNFIPGLQSEKTQLEGNYKIETEIKKKNSNRLEELENACSDNLDKIQNVYEDFKEVVKITTIMKKVPLAKKVTKPDRSRKQVFSCRRLLNRLRLFLASIRKYTCTNLARELQVSKSRSLTDEYERRFMSGLVLHSERISLPELPMAWKSLIEKRGWTDHVWNQFLGLPIINRISFPEILSRHFISAHHSCTTHSRSAATFSKIFNDPGYVASSLIDMKKTLNCFRNSVYLAANEGAALRFSKLDVVPESLRTRTNEITMTAIKDETNNSTKKALARAFETGETVDISSPHDTVHCIPTSADKICLLLELGEPLELSTFEKDPITLAHAYLFSIGINLSYRYAVDRVNNAKINLRCMIKTLDEYSDEISYIPRSIFCVGIQKMINRFFGSLRPVSLALVHHDSLEFFTDTEFSHVEAEDSIKKTPPGGQMVKDVTDSYFEKCLASGEFTISCLAKKSRNHSCDLRMNSKSEIMYTCPIYGALPICRRITGKSLPITAILQFTMPNISQTSDRRQYFDINSEFTKQTLNQVISLILYGVESTSKTRDRLKSSLRDETTVTHRCEVKRKVLMTEYMARMLSQTSKKYQAVSEFQQKLIQKLNVDQRRLLAGTFDGFSTRRKLQSKLGFSFMYYYKQKKT